MADDYRRPIKVNRYWNRPKPKVYECNIRDAERLYQDSYKQYQQEKNFRYGLDRYSTDTDRFAHLRAGPVRRRETASATRYVDPAAQIDSILSRASAAKEASSSESTTTTTLPEAKPVSVYDPQKETASLEERLARLKRLREDLGLPSDSQSSQTTLRESATRSASSAATNDYDSSSYKSERSRRAVAGGDDSSSYSYRSERSSAKVNGIGSSSSAGDEFKLTPRMERKNEELNITPKLERKSFASSKADSDDYSFSSKSEKKTDRFSKLSATSASSSSPVRSRKAVAAAAAAASKDTLDFDGDDDESVVKMMKKLPSSQEILDRISKMELDD